jgi:BirA family biotin operon repressor/biotin-[acetyl-CoA-carboxylase] ligase
VNDVFLGGKKVCGILTEGVSNLETGMIDSAIVGIGINIAAGVAIPDEVREVAGFIEDYTDGKECDKNLVIASVLGELVKIYDNIEDGNKDEEQKCPEEYRNRSLLTGLTVKVSPVIAEEKTSYNARVVGISDELALIVETDSGEKRYLKSGEVTLKSANIAKLS